MNSVVSSDRRNKIIEDSESFAKWALSRCIGAQEDKIVGCSVRRYSVRWEFEILCRQA
jgi:hypothetical protein